MRWTTLFLVLIGLSCAETGELGAAATSPNIVLILGDDQAWTDFGFMGSKTVRTPHLDRLALQSAIFPRAYVPTSLCRPSLATIISGQYPHQHRISGNDPPKGTDRNSMLKHIRRIPTIPRMLGQKGYASFQSGKWWEGNFAEGGFTAGMTHGDPSRGGRHGDVGLKIGREGLKPILDFLDTTAGKPFFVWYAPIMPHTPHNPPERFLKNYKDLKLPQNVIRYYAMCEWFDETCGELLGEIDRRGLSDNTLVVFVTDNGWIAPPQEPGKRAKAPYAPRSKNSPYEGGIRSPILVRWPKHVTPGLYEALASSIDIAPTMLAAAGLKTAAEMTGLNLIDIANSGGKSTRETFFGEIFAHDVADIDNAAPGLRYRWVIERNWKAIFPADNNAKPELFDLVADPFEKTDRANEHAPKLAALKSMADNWWPGK
ncbi:MAG: sulfatase [Planctomycetaceae bacterium]